MELLEVDSVTNVKVVVFATQLAINQMSNLYLSSEKP
jgi:hypothetical protein